MFCFFKQKTAYEMRISDWSSDVCSSDLYFAHACVFAAQTLAGHLQVSNDKNNTWTRIQAADAQSRSQMKLKSISSKVYRAILAVSQIGRASCRARVCKYVSISVVSVSLKKKYTKNSETNTHKIKC